MFETSQSSQARQRQLIRTFFAGAVFPLAHILVGFALPIYSWLYPQTYDAYLLKWDGALGFQPSFELGRVLLAHPLIWNLTTVVYYAVPFWIITLYASHRKQAQQSVAILEVLLSFMIVGFFLYGFYPAVGPSHAFRSFPNYPPKFSEIVMRRITIPDGPRNCMPSLHFAAVLLLFWNSYVWPNWGRVLCCISVFLVAFATLGLGEHYLADLVVAFPFCLLMQSFWTQILPFSNREKFRALIVGATLTVTWFALLRYGMMIFIFWRALSWILSLFTIGATLIVERKLATARKQAQKLDVTVRGIGSTLVEAN